MAQFALPRKEVIVIATIEAINKYGVQSVSTKEIAKQLNISESLIYKYYPRKVELLLAVLEHYAKYDAAIIESSCLRNMTPRDAILYFFEIYAGYYENYPEITSISQSLDVLMVEPELRLRVKEIFASRTKFIQEHLETAQKGGMIEGVDCEIFAGILTGTFREIGLKWRMNNGDFSLKERVLNAITWLLDNHLTQ